MWTNRHTKNAVERIIMKNTITGSHDSGNSVVSPVGLVYGKPVTLKPCISETAERNSTKFGRGHYVVPKFMCANFQKNRAAGFFPAHTQHVHPPMAFFFCFFWFHESGYSPNRWTDYHAWYVKRRGLGQGGAFWGLKNFPKIFWPPKLGKTPFPMHFNGKQIC